MIEAFDRQAAEALRRDENRIQRSAVLGVALAAAALAGVASVDAYSSPADSMVSAAAGLGAGSGQCGTLLYVGSAGHGVDLWAPASTNYGLASGRAMIRTGGGQVAVELSMLPRRGRIQTQSYDGLGSTAYGDQIQICQ